jgi:transposase
MRQRDKQAPQSAEETVRNIRRATRRQFSAEEKIRIVLDGLRGEDSIAELCRKEGIAQNLYYRWSKEFLDAGKKRLAGDTAREATSDEVKTLRAEARQLKEALAEATLENRLLKKRMARPVGKRFQQFGVAVCTNVSGLEAEPPPRWRSARSDPHKRVGVCRHLFDQDFGTPIDCQAISLPPPADIPDRSRRGRATGRSSRL